MPPQPPFLPSEVRRALLAEHARIEHLLAEVESFADRVRTGDDTGGRFQAVTHQLRRMLDTHNQAEEEALELILPTVDAWGPLRTEDMMVEHLREHAEMLVTLDLSPEKLAFAIPRLARDLRAHMAHEERTFLSREVLRDDLISTGPTS